MEGTSAPAGRATASVRITVGTKSSKYLAVVPALAPSPEAGLREDSWLRTKVPCAETSAAGRLDWSPPWCVAKHRLRLGDTHHITSPTLSWLISDRPR